MGEDTGVWPPLRETWMPTPVVLVASALGPLPTDQKGLGKPLPVQRGSGRRILTSSSLVCGVRYRNSHKPQVPHRLTSIV